MERLKGFANYSAPHLALLTHHSEQTTRRWIKQDRAPRLVLRWLELTLNGELEHIRPEWDGWTLRRDGRLHSPDGDSFSPDEIRALPLIHQQVSALRSEIRQYKAPQISERQRLTIITAMRHALAALEAPQPSHDAPARQLDRPLPGTYTRPEAIS